MTDTVLEDFTRVMVALVPESDLGKLVWLVVVGLFLLMLTGRLKLEWIGKSVMYVWSRFIKCPLGKHSWRLASIGHLSDSGGVNGLYRCKYCDKQDYFTATLG